MTSFTLPLSDKSKVFKCEEHANAFLTKLQSFYIERDFLDIVLIAESDQTKFEAHRVVLSAHSAYFLAMFRSTLKEAKAYEVELKDVDGATLKLVLDFMYTGTIEICNEIVENVLRAADFYQMSTLIAACCDFMGEQLDVSNCLGIALFAEQHDYTTLKKKSFTFAYNHFEAVCAEKEFLKLDKEQLIKFISPEQSTRSEEKLFSSLLAWIKHDNANRGGHIHELLPHIRYKMLTPEFITENVHLVNNSIGCYELTFKWLKWHLSKVKTCELPAQVETQTEKSFVIGNEAYTIYKCNCNMDWSYINISNVPNHNEYKGLILKNKILVIIGRNLNHYQQFGDGKIPMCFNIETQQWSALPPMTINRQAPGLAELNGDLYVIGGVGVQSMEKYDFYTRGWQTLASFSNNYKHMHVAVLNGLLYVLDQHSSMECYDPITNKWTKMRHFPNMRMLGLTAAGGNLYAIGIINSRSHVVFKYETLQDSWKQLNLNLQRSCTSFTSLNNRLLIFDGSQRDFTEYNTKTGELRIIPLRASRF